MKITLGRALQTVQVLALAELAAAAQLELELQAQLCSGGLARIAMESNKAKRATTALKTLQVAFRMDNELAVHDEKGGVNSDYSLSDGKLSLLFKTLAFLLS